MALKVLGAAGREIEPESRARRSQSSAANAKRNARKLLVELGNLALTPNHRGTTVSPAAVHSPGPPGVLTAAFMSAFKYYIHLSAISIVSFDAVQRCIP
jgi:hypothetical protein